MFDLSRLTRTQRKSIVLQAPGMLSATARELNCTPAAITYTFYGRSKSARIKSALEQRVAALMAEGKIAIPISARRATGPSKTATQAKPPPL